MIRSYRILLAEDDPDLLSLLAAALWRDGYDVVQARDGSELLDKLGDAMLEDPAVGRFDIIISDDRMPGWTGLEMLAGLTHVPDHPSVVLMTAFGSPDFRHRAHAMGAAATLDKPFDLGMLRAVLLTILAQRGLPGLSGSPH